MKNTIKNIASVIQNWRLFISLILTGLALFIAVPNAKTQVQSDIHHYFIEFTSTASETILSYSANQNWSTMSELNLLLKEANTIQLQKAFRYKDNRLAHIYSLETTDDFQSITRILGESRYVVYVERIPEYSIFYTPNDVDSKQWNLDIISAAGAWDLERDASTIIVGMVDDAVLTTHPDLKDNIWINPGETLNGKDDDGNGYIDDINGYDVANGDGDPNPPATADASTFSHGTHCAGITSAKTDNSTGIASIGFNAKIMAVKTAPDASSGKSLPCAYNGVDYAMNNGANIISMSWGGGGYSKTYQTVFDVAHDAGIVLVAAAGNSNVSTPMYPASYDHVISVAASTSKDLKASFSNFGSKIDVTAPGHSIWSTVAGTGEYGYKSGTSMACPLVSGLCALMLASNPGISPDDLEACLKSSCDNIDGKNSSYAGQLGAGRINAERAIQCVKGVISAIFSYDRTDICPGQDIQFRPKYNDTAGRTYQWLFTGGSPSSSTAVSPKIRYNSTGTYDVTCIVSLGAKRDTVIKEQLIDVRFPSAVLSGDYTISKGNWAYLKVSLKGAPPYKLTYQDEAGAVVIDGIKTDFYFIPVNPKDTFQYSLIELEDNNCKGGVSGLANVYVLPPDTSCNREEFAVTFSQKEEVEIGDVLVDSSGNIYACGSIVKSSGTRVAYLMKINKNGQFIFAREYSGIRNFGQMNFAMDNDDMLLKGSSNDDVTFTRLSSTGNIVWSRIYDFADERYFYQFAASTNNGYIIAGMGNTSGISDDDIFAFKVNGANGNIIWQKRYHVGDDQVSFAVSNDKGGVYIGGNDGKSQGAIAEIDADGDLIRYAVTTNTQCRYITSVDGDLITMSMIGTSAVSIGLSRWDMTSSSVPKSVWNIRLNILSPVFNNHIYTNPYTGNTYVSYINNNDGTSNLALVSPDGKLRDAAIAEVDNRFKMGFNKDDMVMIGTRERNGLWEVIMVKRKDGDALASCFLSKKAFSTSTFSTSASLTSMTDRSISLNVSSPTTSIKSVEFTTECVCVVYNLAVSKDSICVGDSTTLSASGGSLYRWVPNPSIDPNDLQKAKITVSPDTTTTYRVVVFNCECPGDTLDVTIHVERVNEDVLRSDTMICAGDTIPLSAPSDWKAYSWGPDDRMIHVSKSEKSVYPVKDAQYFVNGVSANGCVINDTIDISIDPCCLVQASIELDSPLLCWGDKVYFKNTSINKPTSTYKWQFPLANNGTSFVGYNPPMPTYDKAGDYVVRLIVESTCGEDTVEAYFSLIEFKVDAGRDTSVCVGDSAQIGLTEVSDFVYRWSPPEGLSDTTISNPVATISGPKTYILRVIDLISGCSAIDSLSVDLIKNDGSVLPEDTVLCAGDTFFINLKPEVTNPEWHDGSTSLSYVSVGDTLISVKAYINSCFFNDSLQIDYINPPVTGLPKDTVFCDGFGVNLSAIFPGANYLWLHNNSTKSVEHIQYTGWFHLRIANRCGSLLDSVYVESEDCSCYPFVPNAFTPNSDNLNEGFKPSLNCDLTHYDFSVFNRWGERIFQSTDPSVTWDGQVQGRDVQTNVYFWILRYTPSQSGINKTIHLNGTVKVLR